MRKKAKTKQLNGGTKEKKKMKVTRIHIQGGGKPLGPPPPPGYKKKR